MMRRDDRGAAGVEAALAVTAFLMVGFFLIGGIRVLGSASDVNAAAHAGARAAAAERDLTAASAAASSVVRASLGDRGVACSDLQVSVGGDVGRGGIVTVDVTCTVQLSDAALAGFPGSKTVSGRGVEQVDVVRGGG